MISYPVNYIIQHLPKFLLNCHWLKIECVTRDSEGKCDLIGGQCWCLHKDGTPGFAVCGYPSDYNGTYYSIASDSYPSPWTIIKRLGRIPHPRGCKSDTKSGCEADCATNICKTTPNDSGCFGTKLTCSTDKSRWSESRKDAIVRCTNMER